MRLAAHLLALSLALGVSGLVPVFAELSDECCEDERGRCSDECPPDCGLCVACRGTLSVRDDGIELPAPRQADRVVAAPDASVPESVSPRRVFHPPKSA